MWLLLLLLLSWLSLSPHDSIGNFWINSYCCFGTALLHGQLCKATEKKWYEEKRWKQNSPSQTGMWVNVNRRHVLAFALRVAVFGWAMSALGLFRRALVSFSFFVLSKSVLSNLPFFAVSFPLRQATLTKNSHHRFSKCQSIWNVFALQRQRHKWYAMSYACAPIHMVAIYWLEIDKLYYDTRTKKNSEEKRRK